MRVRAWMWQIIKECGALEYQAVRSKTTTCPIGSVHLAGTREMKTNSKINSQTGKHAQQLLKCHSAPGSSGT
jgi:hypothetical protein